MHGREHIVSVRANIITSARDHTQEHDAGGRDRQRDEKIADDRVHVEDRWLLEREIQLVEAIAQMLDLRDLELARQKDRLIGEELREAQAQARQRRPVIRDHREAERDREEQSLPLESA